MKKTLITLILLAITFCLFFYKCSNRNLGETKFNFSIVENKDFKNLPALQSFAFATYKDYWIMLGGRTNGFHGFPNQPTPAFPYSKANKYIYVYNTKKHILDSMSVYELPQTIQNQYATTNMQQTQYGDFLYLCGGYGKADSSSSSKFITDSTISRINLPALIQRVSLKRKNIMLETIFAFDSKPNFAVCATGGELIKLENGSFYLCVGHRYYGEYSDTLPPPIQRYRNNVTVFDLIEKSNSISINPSTIKIITDNLPDTTTQFHRRDLVVAPAILGDKKSVGISIYGGVFTSKNSTPYLNPIYLTEKSYKVFPFKQPSNHYSAAHIEMYSKESNKMFTTIVGGIVDGFSDTSNASFTKKILTLEKNYEIDIVKSFYNKTELDTFMGSESVFVLSNNLSKYKNNYSIIDFDKIPVMNKDSDSLLIGFIYGGILSTAAQSNQYPSSRQTFAPTFSSNKVYSVYINKYSKGSESNNNIIFVFLIFIILIPILFLLIKKSKKS